VPGPSSAPDRPAAKPAPVVASVSTTSVLSAVSLPSLTPSECDAAVQALESVTSRQLRVGCDENSVWRDRYYLLSLCYVTRCCVFCTLLASPVYKKLQHLVT